MWTRRAAAGPDPRPRSGSVLVAMVLVASGAYVVFPLLPALQATLGIGTGVIGLVAAAGFASALVAELALAPFADRGWARVMGVAGVVLMAASLLLSGLAADAATLVAGRALGGLGFGAFLAAASALLVRAAPTRAGESLGRLGAAELIGVSLGPLVSGLGLVVAGPGAILVGSAAVVLLAVVPVALGFGVGRGPAPAPGRAAPALPPRISLDLLRSPRVVAVLLIYGAAMVPNGAYDGIWPRFMTDLGATALLTAASYTLFAVPYALLAGWAGRLADRRGGVWTFVRGTAVLVPMIALYAVVGSPWTAAGAGLLESSGQALAIIGASAAMAQVVPAARAGASQGLMRAFGLLTATVAAALSGVAYEIGGPVVLFGGTAAAVVLLAAAGVLLVRASRPRRVAAAGAGGAGGTSDPAAPAHPRPGTACGG